MVDSYLFRNIRDFKNMERCSISMQTPPSVAISVPSYLDQDFSRLRRQIRHIHPSISRHMIYTTTYVVCVAHQKRIYHSSLSSCEIHESCSYLLKSEMTMCIKSFSEYRQLMGIFFSSQISPSLLCGWQSTESVQRMNLSGIIWVHCTEVCGVKINLSITCQYDQRMPVYIM